MAKEVTEEVLKLATAAFESERPQVLPNPYDGKDNSEEIWR